MAFLARELSVLAYANGFTLWHYRTSADDLLTPGYFDSAQDFCAKAIRSSPTRRAKPARASSTSL